MRVLLITQNEPFYLAEAFQQLLKDFPDGCQLIGCIVLSPSPMGKSEPLWKRAKKTWATFGTSFFVHYAVRFLRHKVTPETQVERVMKQHGVPLIQLEKSINHAESREMIRQLGADVFVSVQANQIFRRPLIDLAPQGVLNLHTALLPKYRGLMPTFWALRHGESETGVSVFFVDEGIDSGPILVQKRLPIPPHCSLDHLIRRTKSLGMTAICEALSRMRDGNTETLANPEEEMSYYSFPTRKDVKAFLRIGGRFF
ncbi:MAG: formyltransferase family protein [Myxococcota bacterium]|nr:formyltransferase family protein [Myxococcota bacterium]